MSARRGGACFVIADVQRDLLAARAVGARPPPEADLIVDQLVELVVSVVVVSVVIPRVAVGRPGVPGLLHLGERQHRLASRSPSRIAQQRGPFRIGALEPTPVQASLGVLVVKQVHQPAGRIEGRTAISWGGPRAEVLGQAVRQFADRSGSLRVPLACGQQVEGERHPVSGPDGHDLVPAVGIERDEAQLLLRRTVALALPGMVDDQLSASVRGRQ